MRVVSNPHLSASFHQFGKENCQSPCSALIYANNVYNVWLVGTANKNCDYAVVITAM